MTKPFYSLRLSMTSESQSNSKAREKQMLSEMPFTELRRARELTQKMLAEVLNLQDSSILKLEQHTDLYLSTLRTHIQAMGGELEIIARFPYGSFSISSFSDLESSAESNSSKA